MIKKRENYKEERIKDLEIVDKNGNSFLIVFAGNLDLYWLGTDGVLDYSIDKSDLKVFNIIDNLFKNIQKCDDKSYHKTIQDNKFFWLSDDGEESIVNQLEIIKNDNSYDIHFIKNLKLMQTRRTTAVCFCNSGSRNQPVVQEFMKMYLEESHKDETEEEAEV